EPDEVDVWPAGYTYPDPSAVPLVFVPVPEKHAVKNRVHLDLATTSAQHQRELVARLRELGAAPADIGQGEVAWEVLADPEGNELCVLAPRAARSSGAADGIGKTRTFHSESRYVSAIIGGRSCCRRNAGRSGPGRAGIHARGL